MDRDPRFYLWDVKQAADQIAEFLEGRSVEDYLGDRMLRAAVERQFEIIGEALRQLANVAPELAQRIPEISKAIAMRNILIHGYMVIDDRTVWRTAFEKLPELREQIAALIDEVGEL